MKFKYLKTFYANYIGIITHIECFVIHNLHTCIHDVNNIMYISFIPHSVEVDDTV